MKHPCVYILARRQNGTLYVGVTSDIYARMSQHKRGLIPGFSKRYGIKLLVYHEMHHTMDEAIRREKRIKKWKRTWKLNLIERMNPGWIDLLDATTGTLLPGPLDPTPSDRHI